MKRSLLPLLAVLSLAPLAPAQEGPVRHVVAFRFKEGTELAKIQELEKAFAGLKDKIPAIQEFEWGTNVSPEGKHKGMSHLFFMTFKNGADRDVYLKHPDHVEFVKLVRTVVDDAFVLDYIPHK